MDYCIGDVQGLYTELMQLLDVINFDEERDRLWFVGDLVNRGPDSLKVLRFIHALKTPAIISLGNHDLHSLARYHQTVPAHPSDTLDELLSSADADMLFHWLAKQPLAYYDESLKVFMAHAGLPPLWSKEQALSAAHEVEQMIASNHAIDYFQVMYGNEPSCWQASLQGMDRLRAITNYLTRMRYLSPKGELNLNEKGNAQPPGFFPWFEITPDSPRDFDIVFGHWAALKGQVPNNRIHALDTGCVWGGKLTALCLQTKIRYSHL